MEKQAYFKSIQCKKNSNIRKFQTPEGMFIAVKTPDKDWYLYKSHANYDQFLKVIKCSESAHNKTLYRHYIIG